MTARVAGRMSGRRWLMHLIRVLIGLELLTKSATLAIVSGGYLSGRTGLAQALVITLIAYFAVVGQWANGFALLVLLCALAVIQMTVQLVYFLHLGDEVGPRYKLASFLFMTGILLIIVVGSLWIMHHLNYNMMNMTPDEKSDYMLKQHDKGF